MSSSLSPPAFSTQILDASFYGWVAGGTDNATSGAMARLTAAMAATTGGIVYFQPGTYYFSQPWVLDKFECWRIIGAGSNQASGGPVSATILLYTGTGSSAAISCLSAIGVKFEGLSIQWTDAGFTGYLMDFGAFSLVTQNTQNCGLDNCCLRYNNNSVMGAPAALLHIDWDFNFSCTRTVLRGGNFNVLGRTDSSHFNNSVLFQQCNFGNATTCAVKGVQSTWLFSNCVFEPLASGAAGALTYDSGLAPKGVTFNTCWFGDDKAADVGAWITWGAGNSLNVQGCFIGVQGSTTAILINQNAAIGINIQGNNFVGGGGSSIAVDFGTTTGHTGFTFISNSFGSIHTVINGTVPIGSIYDIGNGVTLDSPNITGAISVSSLTTPSITVTGAPTLPNVLTAATADFETGTVGNWLSNTHASLATTTAAALHGTHSLAATCTSSGTAYAIASYGPAPFFSGLVPVAAGDSWTALASFLCSSGTPTRQLQLDIYGVTSVGGGTLVGFSKLFSTGNATQDSTTQWRQLKITGTIPSSGVNDIAAVISWSPASGQFLASGEVHYVDCCSISQLNSTTWQDPAAASQSLTITPTTIQGTTDAYLLAGSSGAVWVNHGPSAGTGGTNLGGNVSAPDGGTSRIVASGAGAGFGAAGGYVGSDNAGYISLVTGSGCVPNTEVLTFLYSTNFPVVPRSVSFTPANNNAAALTGGSLVWEDVNSRTISGGTLMVGLSGLQDNTLYYCNVMTMG